MARTSLRMLIVAADPTLRFTLEELLGYYGYAVTTAASTAEAEDLIKQGEFNLLLLAQPLRRPDDRDHVRNVATEAYSEPAGWLEWIPF